LTLLINLLFALSPSFDNSTASHRLLSTTQDLKGKVFFIFNSATKCGFTPQLDGLEKLHQKYKDQGLVIIGFPSDQFGSQNPEDDEETGAVCQRNYGVSFPFAKKSDVNGSNTNEVFKFLKSRAKGLLGERIAWNFTKFLVDKASPLLPSPFFAFFCWPAFSPQNGNVLHRYAPTTKPESIEADIQKALAA
jgi:glutathione peroxidase-family protein